MNDRNASDIHIVLVPTGAESQAVKQGLSSAQNGPEIIEIPAGPQAFKGFLRDWYEPQLWLHRNLLLVGLGGSLSTELTVGDGVLVERFVEDNSGQLYECDRAFTQQLSQQLGLPIRTGVTCDRVITTVAEKRQLGDRYTADVVDMESAVLLKAMPAARIAVLRVISDDCDHDLPAIGNAIRPDGTLNPLRLATGFLKNPVAALKFVRGSLEGLKQLRQLMSTLIGPNPRTSP
ncbi:MAG: hypothetical protein AAGG53_11355 [Cyanobacteria bacterium P01_H01_bin.152]